MAQSGGAPLITAKCSVPPLRRAGVARPRLYAPALDREDARLTLVAAPAGWGKTTLLSQWAHDSGGVQGIAWVSLDETDDESTRFWSYVPTGLQGIVGVTAAPLAALLTPAKALSIELCRC